MKDFNQYNWKVYVSCLTYNHAPYIVDAMNGFCMQETDFPFVCVIIDDASTDSEPEVIKHFLEDNFKLDDYSTARNDETDDYYLCFAQHKTNLNCYFAVYFLKYNHYQIKKPKDPYLKEWRDNAKYIAICEGDDYWTQPHKLQIQVVFLEAHPDYTLCFHNGKILAEKGARVRKFYSEIVDKDYQDKEIFNHFIVPTASVVFKSIIFNSELLQKFRNEKKITIGDLPLWLTCCKEGKVRGLSQYMSVYRQTPSNWTSISRNYDEYIKGAERSILIWKIYGDNLKHIAQKQYAIYMLAASSSLRKEGKSYFRPIIRSLSKYPLMTILVFFSQLFKTLKKKNLNE